MSDIFEEIDEDLRKDQAKALWIKYRIPIIAGVGVIILLVAAYNVYQHLLKQQGEANMAQFTTIMQQLNDENSREETALALKSKIENGEFATGLFQDEMEYIAQMSFASLAQELKDFKNAADYFEAIKENQDLGQYERDLVSLLAVRASYLAGESHEKIMADLDQLLPLLASNNRILYAQGQILRAEIALAMGQKLQATNILIGLRDDAATDPTMRNFTNELISLLDLF